MSKRLFGQILLMVVFTIVTGAAFAFMVYSCLPASGASDFDRGSYSTVAPLIGLFFLMGIGALVGLLLEWRQKA